MELRQLEYLLAIKNEKTLTAAAEKLFVSQSALSQQMKRLEKELGTLLFDRSRNRMQLTEAGHLLYKRAKRIIKEVDEAQIAIDELGDLCRGTLEIGVVQTVNTYLIPRVASAFSSRFPLVHLRIKQLSAPQVEQMLYDYELDMGISFLPTGDIEFDSIFDEELLFITPPDHPLANKEKIEPEQLDNQKIIMLSKDYYNRQIWEQTAKESGVNPDVIIEMNNIGSILSTLQHNSTIGTILPALTMEIKAAEGLKSIQLANPTPKRTIGFLWRNGNYRSMASTKFAQIFKEEFTHLSANNS